MSRLLAIDFGMKRCGIAVTDPEQIIATALNTVNTKELASFLKTYLSHESVEAIILGDPRNLDNSPTEISANAEKVAEWIRLHFPQIPVYREDERFTSKMASQAMAMGNMKKKDRQMKGNIDRISAVLILQSFMEKRNFESQNRN